LAVLGRQGPVAIVDPHGAAEGFAEIFGLEAVAIAGVYVQDVTRCGTPVLGRTVLPLTELAQSAARSVLVAGFDAERLIGQLRPFRPPGAELFSLDAMRIPEE